MSDVFISYSHKDGEVLERMKRHFKPLENRVKFWDDTKILPGMKWREEIQKALISARVAILLISADFFASSFIEKIELPTLLDQAQKNGVLILSVIVRPCLFEEYPEISKYQAMNSPQKTIIQLTEAEQEILYSSLVKRVKEYLLM